MVFLGLVMIFGFSCQDGTKEERTPNIIYFLADDLGYGEIGVNGQSKILTPHIDALAAEGILFTRHYSGAPVCAPARCTFLTGLHAGHAYIRGNDEMKEKGEVWDYLKASQNPYLEGQRPLLPGTVTIGRILQDAGYETAIIGKWGLGGPTSEGIPTKQGFDYFYGYNCQRQAHNLYPGHLWENETRDQLDNVIIPPNTKLDTDADIYDPASYARYTQKDYAPDKMQEKALAFVRQNKEKPFFLYYASPLPHLPLQAPVEEVNFYRERFGDEEPYLGDSGYFPCRYPRATYAAMISILDRHLGELVNLLKQEGIYDNTLIVFSSDNGTTYLGGVDYDFFNSSNPFVDGYGHTKGFVYEGGIRVPTIASWPDKIRSGGRSEHLSANYDMLATFCDVASCDIPKETDGISIFPTLIGKGKQKEHEFLYWEFPSYKGQQALHMGQWKGVRQRLLEGNLDLELYDLSKDITEENNVAGENPEIVQKMLSIMADQHSPSPLEKFRIPALDDQ